MNTAYKSNSNILCSCKYRVVWCPKNRRNVGADGADVRRKELLLEYAANLSIGIMEMEIMPDHVHSILENKNACPPDKQLFYEHPIQFLRGSTIVISPTEPLTRGEYPYCRKIYKISKNWFWKSPSVYGSW